MWGCKFGLLLGRRGEQAVGCQGLGFVEILVQEGMEGEGELQLVQQGQLGQQQHPKTAPHHLDLDPQLRPAGPGLVEREGEGRQEVVQQLVQEVEEHQERVRLCWNWTESFEEKGE